MKNAMKLSAIMLLGVVLACGGQKLGGAVQGETMVEEGWLNDDTFVVIGLGVAPARLANRPKIQRRYAACAAAKIDAQSKVVEKLVGATIQGAAGTKDGELIGQAVKKEFSGSIRGGTVIKSTFDPNENSCEVKYKIEARNLKATVKKIAERYIKNIGNQ